MLECSRYVQCVCTNCSCVYLIDFWFKTYKHTRTHICYVHTLAIIHLNIQMLVYPSIPSVCLFCFFVVFLLLQYANLQCLCIHQYLIVYKIQQKRKKKQRKEVKKGKTLKINKKLQILTHVYVCTYVHS